MKTKVLKPTDENFIFCANLLKSSKIVAVPTETVYGLAANAFDYLGVEKIFKAKGRPQNNPLICHINSMKMFYNLTNENSELLNKLLKAFWPGPLTVIVRKNVDIPSNLTANLNTIGIRFSSNKILNKLIEVCGFPLAAPSANLSKKPSATNTNHVLNDFNGKIPAILDGGNCEVGIESTIVKIEKNKCVVLRPGFVTVSMLKNIVKNVQLDEGVLKKPNSQKIAVCPGVNYLHYSPNAEIIVVKGSFLSFYKYVSSKLNCKTWCAVFDKEKHYFKKYVLTYGENASYQAKNLFLILRKIDDLNLKRVFFRSPTENGIGLAVYNRLIRAANFKIVNLN